MRRTLEPFTPHTLQRYGEHTVPGESRLLPAHRQPMVGMLLKLVRSLLLLVAWQAVAIAQTPHDLEFIFPMDGVADYPPAEMVDNCEGTYDDATATALFTMTQDASTVTIQLRDAAPDTLYTAWLRLGTGGSPLTGAGSTALADPSAIGSLGALTPSGKLTAAALAAGLVGDDGSGSAAVANGFMTDGDGNGTLTVNLSFSLADGIYPFTDFDASISDMPLGDNPFAIRVVSHCVDGVGHGLDAGTREAWFDLPAIVVPEPHSGLSLFVPLGAVGVVLRRRRLTK